MVKLSSARLFRRRRFHSLHQFRNAHFIAHVDQMVRIGDPEIDFVVRLELLAQNLLAVDKRSMPAAAVFQNQSAVHAHNLRLLTADAAVPQGQFVICLAADPERHRRNFHLPAVSAWFDNDDAMAASWHGSLVRRKYLATSWNR